MPGQLPLAEGALMFFGGSMSKLRGFLGLAAVATLGLSLNAVAQSTTQGAISGTVFDATDAAISNAKITIHNDGTNQDVVLTSAGGGEFKAPLLPPGTYTVTVDATGFSASKTTQVIVTVGNVTTLNPHLATGSTEQTVEVVADIPAIDFSSATFGGHLSTSEIANIPINNRRWSSLALTTPGVTNDASGFGLLSFRGIPSVLNNVQIDGTDDNQAFFSEERGRTRAGYSISQVSVREFQVMTGVYSAEYGRAVGGVVNSVTKSGGNQLHGEVYFFHRNDKTSSKNEKTTLTTLNPTTNTYTPQVIRPKDKRNQYGFGVGGPLIKDKLFWFYAFDVFDRQFPGIAVSGNPSTFYSATAGPCQTSGLLTATGASLAQCNAALADLNTDLGSVPRYGHQNINTPKLSWVISPKHTLDVYYHRLRWDSPGGVQTQAALSYARDSFGTDFVKLDYGIARLSSLINNHMTNELRYQYARELNWEGQQPYTDYSKNHLVGANGVTTYASITASAGGFNLGSPYYSYRTAYPDERKWQIGDTASYQFGKHTLRFGVDFVHNYDIQNNLYQSNGSYSYANVGLYLADILKPSGACNPLTSSGTPTLSATGTAGCHSGLSQGFGPQAFDLATLDSAYFVQDDWKVTPSLTLNLGARYDYESYPGPYASAVNSAVPQQTNHPTDKNNISPRIGFAWDPFGKGKSVVRGGFGIYYGRIINASLMSAYTTTGGAGGQLQITAYNGTNVGTTSAPQTIKFPQTLSARPGGNVLLGVLYLDKNLQNPYTEQFDLTVQQDLGKRNVLSVSYIGSLGRELPNFLNLNLDPTQTYNVTYTLAANAAAPGNCLVAACGTTFTQKVYSSSVRNTVANTTTSNTLNPAYNQITPLISNVNSSYNALTVDVTNRQWKRISYDVNYTWAHALDYAPSSSTSFSPGNNWLDPYNPRSNYGNSNINVPHRLVGWANINLPGVKSNGALSYLLNDWSIKPLIQMQKGLPYSVGTSSGSPSAQCTSGTACLQAYSSGVAGTGVSSFIPFFGRNQLFAPRNIVIDTRLQKDFRIKEGVSFQLMAEAFNLANHRNITGVNSGAFSLANNTLTATTNFGTPSSSGVNGNYAYQVRQFQFSGRVTF